MAVGRTDVISVPNGANSQLDWLDELSESHFEQKQVIYLSVDTDRKGRELCRELSRRLGVDRCRIVTYGEAGRQRTARGGRPGRTTEGRGRAHPRLEAYVYGRRLTGAVAPTV